MSTKTFTERAEALAAKKLATTPEEYKAIVEATSSPFVRSLDEWKAYLQQTLDNPLSGCGRTVVAEFTNNLKFDKGALDHWNYGIVADKLSYIQFQELLAVFGISIKLFIHFSDCIDNGHNCCVPKLGYSCDPSRCHH